MANLTDADKVLRNDVGKNIVQKLNDLLEVVHGGNENLAPTYDSTQTYYKNDKVIYQNNFYRCVDDNSGSGVTGAFDLTKWMQTTISALTAEELPLSGNDSTPTATAIGSLSSLTTTDKSSLVGAVNEVNGKGYNDLSGRPIRYYMVSSSNPITIQGQIVSGYATFIIIGFVASLGGVVLAVQMSGGNLSKVIDLLTGSPFSSSHLTFSGSNSQLTIGSDVNSNSNLMIWG